VALRFFGDSRHLVHTSVDERAWWVTAFRDRSTRASRLLGWKTERPHLIVPSAAVLVVQFICTRLQYSQAMALIIFGGDGGSLVLGSLLMITFYVTMRDLD